MKSEAFSQPLLLKKLSYTAGGRRIFSDLDVEFPAGKVTVLTGASGCGKTSLLRLIAGLESPDAGEILSGDLLLSSGNKILSPWLRNLDMLFQSDSLWPDMTIESQINYVRARNSGPVKFEIGMIIERLGIRHLLERKPARLSGGEARRCQLARVLSGSPAILLLDEPLASQDVDTAASTASLLGDLLGDAGITTVLVSHETDLFEKIGWNHRQFEKICKQAV